MKKLVILFISVIISVLFVGNAFCRDTYVRGYSRQNGTYVQPHYRTAPDSTRNNNYSTYGNTNPYTGQHGNKPGDYGYGNSNNYGNSNGYGSGGLNNNYKRNGYGY